MSYNEIKQWVHQELFQQIPFNIAIIDRDFNIVEANLNFEDFFGDWRDRKCYQAYKGRFSPCPNCSAQKTFKDGLIRVRDEEGIDRYGRISHYVGHIAPIKDAAGNIPYVLEMTTDVTETRRWQRQYNLLFERVPCYITIIDREFRIIRSNEKFRETFGEAQNKHCYVVYKGRRSKCPDCPAEKTFLDGQVHHSRQVGRTKSGVRNHYIVSTSSLGRTGAGGGGLVIEIANDVTELHQLESELRAAHNFRENLIKNSWYGIIATDDKDEVIIFNPAARKILKYPSSKILDKESYRKILPAEFKQILDHRQGSCRFEETELTALDGEKIPVRFTGTVLKDRGRFLGATAFIRDLRHLKQLEKEKLDAERLAAVGQTVAGLAHSVKNILMGLEGGMYMVSTGLQHRDQQRISEGWEVLERNFEKTTSLVKDFLSFARGRQPEVKLIEPNELVMEIYELYKDTVSKVGITLTLELQPAIPKVPLDPDGIHTCLTNLVSNAIDACQMSEQENCRIVLRTFMRKNALFFEVEDNGVGMEYEVKQKVFTTFFTTKGGGGTGLGLLTTRRIIQEHGGSITLESVKGKGSRFRMEFPLNRLPELPING